MRWVPGGDFLMGCNLYYPEERPVWRAHVEGFWIDEHPVTVAEFRRFVRDTGYITRAERQLDSPRDRGAEPAAKGPGALVFRRPQRPEDMSNIRNWWHYSPGASWRRPGGEQSSASGCEDHPVTQVTYDDASAFASWAGKVLPTEAEWEYAARGGLEGSIFAWGDEFEPQGRHMANTWQGIFPWQNLCLDGFEGTSPVSSFPPNGFGLFDMTGNVWEWTSDYFRTNHAANWASALDSSLALPNLELDSPARSAANFIRRRVIKGGSYLCAPNYSARYRPASRMGHREDVAAGDVGFRCISRAEKPEQPQAALHREDNDLAESIRRIDWATRRQIVRSTTEMALIWTYTGLRLPR
jgi:formylglycine-generating enzyme required for sulfatase activity